MFDKLRNDYNNKQLVKILLSTGEEVEGIIKKFEDNYIELINKKNETITLFEKIIGGWKLKNMPSDEKFKKEPLELEEINVKRINLVEDDGTIRMALSNKDKFPGLIFENKEYSHPRGAAGILFYNEEGTECGGLIYTGKKDKNGNHKAIMHLSFDEYNDDQIIHLNYTDENGQNSKMINIQDNKSDQSSIKAFIKYKKLIEEGKKNQAEKFKKENFPKVDRPFRYRAGVNPEGESINYLYDREGNKRISMKVDSDNGPKIEFLDENGKVIYSLPE